MKRKGRKKEREWKDKEVLKGEKGEIKRKGEEPEARKLEKKQGVHFMEALKQCEVRNSIESFSIFRNF